MSLFDRDIDANDAKMLVDSIYSANMHDSLGGLMGKLPEQSIARAIYALGDSILTLAAVVLRGQITQK